MACENLICKFRNLLNKKVQFNFNLRSFKIALPFFLIIFMTCTIRVKANDQFYSFTPQQNTYTYGQQDNADITFHVSYSTDSNSNNFNVYDCKGNLILSGSSGTIPYKDGIYPVKFVCTSTSSNYRIDLVISKDEKQKDYSGLLDGLGKKLDDMTAKVQGLLDKLKELADYLDNPKYLQDGQNNLNNAVSNMQNYSPLQTSGQSSSALSGISAGSGGSLGSISVAFFPGHSINVMDLSAVSGKIDDIKNLMRAMLWISLALYFIAVLIPKLKI